jgi:ABC-type uncharacterized transport system substrate-binding protein
MPPTPPRIPSRPPFRLARVATVVAAGLAAAFAAPEAARAHPHVFVDARLEVQFDKTGRVAALRHVWRFDDAFSAFATQGLDIDGNGLFSQEELAPLAKVNVDSLKDFDYFTMPRLGSRRLGLKLPEAYRLEFDDGYLTLFYSLPLKEPVKPASEAMTIDVYDPSYFVDFDLVKDEPALLVDAPPGCSLDVRRKSDPDPASAALLSQIPASERDVPAELKAVTSTLVNRVTIRCR